MRGAGLPLPPSTLLAGSIADLDRCSPGIPSSILLVSRGPRSGLQRTQQAFINCRVTRKFHLHLTLSRSLCHDAAVAVAEIAAAHRRDLPLRKRGQRRQSSTPPRENQQNFCPEYTAVVVRTIILSTFDPQESGFLCIGREKKYTLRVSSRVLDGPPAIIADIKSQA